MIALARIGGGRRAGAPVRAGRHVRAAEAAIAAALIDAVAAPAGNWAQVRDTDAARFLTAYVGASPPLNRIALRLGLWVLDGATLLAPRYRRRYRHLVRGERTEVLVWIEQGPLGAGLRPFVSIAKLAYYGDAGVMSALGYDAGAVVERAAAVREEAGTP